MRQHSLPIRVYYDDTDVSGVVHHSNYLKFFERGRTEALRTQGFELIDLYEGHGIQFVVHSASIDFLQPARLDQLLYVVTTAEAVRHASILYHQYISLTDSAAPLCVAKIKLACVNRDFKPCALPKFLSMEIKK